MAKKRKHNQIALYNNRGTTLVEMLVCFLMLAIFMVAAFSIISHISKLYYQVKGETYGKQVSDILLEKMESEIEGAKLEKDVILIGDGDEEGSVDNTSGSNITLYDKTDTRVMLYYGADSGASKKYFKMHYYGYSSEDDSWNDNTWQFDRNMYNGYSISELKFIRGSALSDGTNSTLASSYGITNTSGYGDDVMVILLKLTSDHYGDFTCYRFVRMYNYKAPAPATPENP